MIQVPAEFQPHINIDYPSDNRLIFEEWVTLQNILTTEREYLPIQWTSFYVNHNYGQDKQWVGWLQDYINSLDKSKKYWTIVQYDDGILNDISGLDLLQFNMSKNVGIPIPLISMQHEYKGGDSKDIFASFIGNKTHPIRNGLFNQYKENWYISDKPHSLDEFCKIIDKSVFGLCPRGYGINSFRIQECMKYGTIPVYISDEFIIPFDLNFEEFGVIVPSNEIHNLQYILKSYTPLQIVDMQDKCIEVYNEYYTYKGCFDKIIKYLESEYNS